MNSELAFVAYTYRRYLRDRTDATRHLFEQACIEAQATGIGWNDILDTIERS